MAAKKAVTARDKAIKAGLSKGAVKAIDKQIAKAKGGKKPAPKATKSKISPDMVKKFDKAFARWSDLKSPEQISVLAAEIGCKRGALRRQLRKRAGGKAQFKALRNAGAGGVRESLGARPKSESVDKGAKVIPVGGRSNWTSRIVRSYHKGDKVIDYDTPLRVHVAGTTGIEYVTAGPKDAADALAEMGNGLPPARLKLFKQF